MKGGGAAGRELPSGYVAGTNRYMTGEPEESLPSRGSGEEQLAAWADGIRISRLDHLVLTVADIERTACFYEQVLGMERVVFGQGRQALAFGTSKINLHQSGHEFAPHAVRPVPGSADVCLVTTVPPTRVLASLTAHGVAVEEGPVARTGALGPMTSVYIRDPDGNLIEISSYETGASSGGGPA
jgi:catechol 2,3-dioxygenase-like lactoylglutathione lyase family enzyme